METFGYVLFLVVIGAIIGGFTNHLAIKMLFHPRNPIMVAGRRLPFTPGLIPKRREEIAESLGRVVAEYLVTPQGLVSALHNPELRGKLEKAIAAQVDSLAEGESSVDELLEGWLGTERYAEGKARLGEWLNEASERGIVWLWEQKGVGAMKPAAFIPEWEEHRKERLVRWALSALIGAFQEELYSVKGDRLIRQMTSQLLEQGGGLLGSLAGIFMDPDKMVIKVKAALLHQLDSPDVQRAISDFIRRKIDEAAGMSLADMLRSLTERDSGEWLAEQVRAFAQWPNWLDKLGQSRVADWIGPQRETLRAAVPRISDLLLSLLERNMERLILGIELPRIVEDQVRHFPIERLEEIILSVSGREFRAITWLGALLGGMIGLFQAAVSIWWRG